MTLELHPLCTLFPRLAGAEFDALRDDIKANGLREPIVTHDGMVLDGGNRYRACLAAGVEPTFREFTGGNLVSFVLSVNLHRRHMTPGQQAAIVASATDWAKAQTHGGARRKVQAEALPLETVAQRAAVSGATERTQRDADKLVKQHPEKARAVAQGETSLYQAVKDTAPPKPAPKAAADDDGPSVAELLDQMQDDVRSAEARASEFERVALADDGKAEATKLVRRLEQAERARNDAMASAAETAKRAEFYGKQLARCGKAVGVKDLDKIAPAVETMARALKKEPA